MDPRFGVQAQSQQCMPPSSASRASAAKITTVCCLLATTVSLVLQDEKSLLSRADFEKIQKGSMTRAQIEDLLGPPHRVGTCPGRLVDEESGGRREGWPGLFLPCASTAPSLGEPSKLELQICFHHGRVHGLSYWSYHDSTLPDQALAWLRRKIRL